MKLSRETLLLTALIGVHPFGARLSAQSGSIVPLTGLAAPSATPSAGPKSTSKPKASPQPAALAPKPPMASVEKILTHQHTNIFLSDELALIKHAMKERRRELGLSKERQDRIYTLAERIYRRKNLYETFKVAFRKSLSAEAAAEYLTWMATPIGVKVASAYDELYSVEPVDWQAYVDGPGQRIIKPNRKNAIQTLVKVQELAEIRAQKRLGADFALEMAVDSFNPEISRTSPHILKDRNKLRLSGHILTATDPTTTMASYLVKALKNEEIDEISKFSTTPTGQAVTTAFRRALDLTLESAAATLANEIGKGTK